MDDTSSDSGEECVVEEHTQAEIESLSKRNNDNPPSTNLPSTKGALIPKLGMVFNSDEEAFEFYKAYGYRTGFGVMRRTSHKLNGIRYRSAFSCCKGGNPKVKPGPKARRRPVVKTGCMAMMVVRDPYLQNRWEVDALELEHNHPLDPNMVKYMRCFKEMPGSGKEPVQVNDSADVPLNEPVIANNSFIGRSFGRHVGERKKLRLGVGDAEALMRFIDNMQGQNSNFYFSLDMDEEGQLRNVFWADARSRTAYQYFNDVITFDTMCLMDEYKIPLVSFVGVNHHGQPVLLGCGLLADETTETLIWLFRKWLRCMNDRPPNAIITNWSKAIGGSVAEVFPQARHRFCLWHIMRKLPEKLKMEAKEAISQKLSKAVYDSLTSTEFEREWGEMISHFRLQDNELLFSLYEDRKQWVPAYVKDTFWAGMSTTHRSKSMDTFFDGYVTSETSLKIFLGQYDDALKSKLEKEAQDDFRSFHTRPQLISGLQFEEQIAKVYTMNIFYMFQDELKQLMHLNNTVVDKDGSIVTYKVIELAPGKRTEYKVLYNNAEEDVWCICKSFQFRGILCRHALCVLRQELVMLIPSKYILKRWRKDFKRLHLSSSSPEMASKRETSIYDDLYMRCQQYVADIVEIGATDLDLKEFVLSVMKESREKVIKYEELRGDRSVNDNMGPTVETDQLPTKRPASQSEKATNNLKKKKKKKGNKGKSTDPSMSKDVRTDNNVESTDPSKSKGMGTDNNADRTTVQQNQPTPIVTQGSFAYGVHLTQPHMLWPITPIGVRPNFAPGAQQNQSNIARPRMPIGIQGSFPYGVVMHNPAPYFRWPGFGTANAPRRA